MDGRIPVQRRLQPRTVVQVSFQRAGAWRDGLLLTQDRVGSGLLRLTHEFLAPKLGTDRPSVSLAASALQKKKITGYTHGAVKVLNRKKLERCACACYSLIRQFNSEIMAKPEPLVSR